MLVFGKYESSPTIRQGLKALNVTWASYRSSAKSGVSPIKTDDEFKIDREAFEAVEDLGNILINDTSRSVASKLTKEHQRAIENIKAKIVYRKNFRPPTESSVLTYRAREQIAHLSMTSPSEWDARALAEHFPISYRGATMLLLKARKNTHRFYRSLDSVIQHDTQSIKNWITLIETICKAQLEGKAQANESQFLQVFANCLPINLRWIGFHNALDRLGFSDGNPSLPYPPQNSVEAYEFVSSNHQPGPFQQIAERFYKPFSTTSDLIRLRKQQLFVIDKLLSLLKSMDFSVFTNPLMSDSSLSFKTLCRDWLCSDFNVRQLDRPHLPKVKPKVDCDFTKSIRYKWDLSIGSLIDDPILTPTGGDGYRHSLLENSISGLSLQLPPCTRRCLSVLPPIDTFSHQEVEPTSDRQEKGKCDPNSRNRRKRTSGSGQKRNKPLPYTKNGTSFCSHRYLCPVSSCMRARPESGFKRRYLLQEHLNFHRREKPFCCDRCSQRFTSRQNLARHRLIHSGVTYTCLECNHVFLRSSDRSKCMQNHKLQRIISEQETNTSLPITGVTPKATVVSFANPVTGPHVCPICPDHRSYKFDSSLRKHIRLHHPNYRRTTGAKVSRFEPILVKTPAQSLGYSRKSSSAKVDVVNYSLKNSTIAVAPDPTTPHVPHSLNSGSSAYFLSTGDFFYTTDQQYAPVDQLFSAFGTPATDGTTEQRPTIFMELAPTGSAVVDGESRRPAHSTVLGVTEGPLLLTPCLPVDLCTSALCLSITDPPVPTSISSISQQATMVPVETGVCQSITGESALDLTELPHEVIDLSHRNPVDLSGTHPQPSRSVLWEPEPGFSFTDLLNVDDEDPRDLLLVSQFQGGLDLRLSEPL